MARTVCKPDIHPKATLLRGGRTAVARADPGVCMADPIVIGYRPLYYTVRTSLELRGIEREGTYFYLV